MQKTTKHQLTGCWGGGLCWLVNGEGAGPRHGAKDVLAVLTPPVIVVGSPVK